MTAFRLLLVDDHSSVRTGLRMILENAGFQIIGEASTGSQGITMAQTYQPDVVLMDIRMPDQNGIEATREIVESGASRVLIISAFDLDSDILAAIRAGAKGYVLKTIDAEELTRSVAAVARGQNILDPTITESVMRTIAKSNAPHTPGEWPPTGLTPREITVMECISQGLSNRMIARTLNIAETTAKTHVSNALAKLGLTSRVEAAVYVTERMTGKTTGSAK